LEICLQFERVFDGSQVMNIEFLTDDEKQNVEINCPCKLNDQKSGTWRMDSTLVIQHCLATFILTMRDGQSRKVSGDGKFNLFSVAVHEIGHCIGLFHNTEDKDSVMQPIYEPGFSAKTKTRYFLNLIYKQCKK